MIQVQNLTKRFAGITAIDRVSFTVERGEIVGFLGKNGAGKSTTMKILSCYFPPTSGSARVAGFDCVTQSLEVRRRVGYMPERVPLYEDMRVEEYLNLRASLKGVPWRYRKNAVNQAIESTGLREVRRKLCGSLSKGYRQRTGLAEAIVHQPDLLILDEPTAGFDPAQVRQVRELIKDLGTRTTLLLSTHILSEVELTATRLLLIHRGRIVASGSPGSLVGGMQANRRMRLEIKGTAPLIAGMMKGMLGVSEVAFEPLADGWYAFTVETPPDRDARADVANFVVNSGWELRELREERQTLEDLFVQITRTDEAGVAETVSSQAPAAGAGVASPEQRPSRAAGVPDEPTPPPMAPVPPQGAGEGATQ